MAPSAMDQLAEMLNSLRGRRSLALLAAALPAALIMPAGAKDQSPLDRRRKRAEKRSGKRSSGKSRGKGKDKKKAKETGFSASCERFLISAGPSKTDRFKHIDDDLMIELLPAGGNPKVLFKDDNDSPNGPGGSHPTVDPFTAQVGDRIRIVARNEVAGGCELDAIWLHCLEGKGGSVKLLDAVTPNECKKDANTVGVFLDTTVRIRNT
ncbi:MAG: hypothetical protein U0075_24045 [Thermomicrobiales bacterium]